MVRGHARRLGLGGRVQFRYPHQRLRYRLGGPDSARGGRGSEPSVRELFPGVFHWTAFHPRIGARVSSYYIAPAGAVLDPKLPEGGWDALPDSPQEIILTSGHHGRDARALSEMFGIPVRASREAAEHLGDALEVETFKDGDEVAPGITSIHIGELSADEGALHIAVGSGAIAFADGVHRSDGSLAFFSDQLLGDDPERVKRGLARAFVGLLELDFDHLLFAHGEPLIGGGKAALREFATDVVGDQQLGQSR